MDNPHVSKTRVVNLKGRPSKDIVGGEVYIGRAINLGGWSLPGSKWQNRFKITRDETREQVLQKYREWLKNQPHLMASLHELKGKTLCCWCKPQACHGDILAELANQV